MRMAPTFPVLLSVVRLRIDGVEHEPGALTVLRRDERLPGGLRWSLEVDQAIIMHHCAASLRTGRLWPRVEMQLFSVLRHVLRRGYQPRFCIATIDSVKVGTATVRFNGRCAPLAFDAVNRGGLATRV